MHGAAGGPSEWRSRLHPGAAVLLVVACGAPPSGKVPDFLASLPSLGTASARYDSAMNTFTRDLEAWAARFDQGDSLRHAADTASDQLLAWAGREAEPAADRTDSLRSPVFPPPANDRGRGAVAMVKCSLITLSVLPSKEGCTCAS